MAVVHIRINNKLYDLACDDGQEEQLRLLADEVDERVQALVYRMGGNPGDAMALLLTALTMADEINENKKEIHRLNSGLGPVEPAPSEQRMAQIEAAMAVTLEEIAQRIEKIADQVEMR